MTTRLATSVAVCAVLAAVTFSRNAARAESDDVWHVGRGRATITPTEPVLLSGYGGRDRPFERIDADLFAKSLAIEDQHGHLAVLVTLDVECMRDHTAEPLIEKLCAETGLQPGQFLLNFSHTHAAPFLSLDPNTTDYGSTPETAAKTVAHTRWLIDRVVAAVREALDGREPARLSFGIGVAPFVMSRREFTPTGVRIGANSRGFVDRSVPVLRVDDLDGRPRAIVFGCACHNTTLTGKDFVVSGDYAGYAQSHVEDLYPGVQAMFMIGCGGDANPWPRGTVELARLHGHTLGEQVAAFLDIDADQIGSDRRGEASLSPVRGPLAALREEVELPLRTPDSVEQIRRETAGNDRWKAYHGNMLLALLEAGRDLPHSYRCPLAVWQFGSDLTLVGFSGEMVAGYVPLIEDSLGPRGLWIAAYCNEQFGYVPTARVIEQGGYETRGLEDGKVGQFAPEVEQVLVTEAARLTEQARQAAAPDDSTADR